MIKVRVRQKDNVDLWQLVEFDCGRGQSFGTDRESRQSNPDAREKNGIGKNFNAEEIDEHGGVTEPGRGHPRVIPFRWIWLGKSREQPAASSRVLLRAIDKLPSGARVSFGSSAGQRSASSRCPHIPSRLIPARESMPFFPPPATQISEVEAAQ